MKRPDLKLIWKKTMHSLSTLGSDADRDWKILLSLFILTLVAAAAFHTKLFLDVEGIKEEGGSLTATTTELVSARDLATTLAGYDARAADFQSIATSTFSFVDPAK